MLKKKINREHIKELVLKGYSDHEIGDLLGCATITVTKIRLNELKITKTVAFLREWKRVTWRPRSHSHIIDAAYIVVPLSITRTMFPDGSDAVYKINRDLPNKLTIEFKMEEDICDRELIRGRLNDRRRRRIRPSSASAI